MACLFMDSFDHYGDASLGLKWSGAALAQASSGIAAGYGRNGTAGFRSQGWGGSAADYAWKVLPGDFAALVVGTAMRMSVLTVAQPRLRLLDTGTVQMQVWTDALGRFAVYRGGTLLATDPTPRSTGTYYYVELKVVFATGATGSYELRVNGQTALLQTNIQTAASPNAYANKLDTLVGGGGGAGATDIDDLYIFDTSGTANNDFAGDVTVQCLFPDGDGADLQWTPSTGTTHYDLVDDPTPNDDADYVSDAAAGDRDTYTFGDLRAATGSVLAVQVLIYARKDDAGTRQIAPVVRIAATNYDGATLPNLGTTYTWSPAIYETSPATSTSWTVAEVNAAEFGVKLVA